MDDALIDRIYEAAFVPERWREVLQALAAGSGGLSAALLIYDGMRQPRWQGTPLIDEVLARYCTTDAWQRSELTPYMLNVPPASFFYDADYFPAEVLARDLMRAPLRALGIGNQIGTLIPMPSGEHVCITVERQVGMPRPSPGVMAALASVRPHLARAGLMAARLGLERARAAVATLAALGLPAAILSHDGRVLAANALLENLHDVVIFAAHGKLAIKAKAADELFHTGLAEITRSRDAVRSIPVPAEAERQAFIVHLVPVRGGAHDIFSGGSTAVILSPIGTTRAPDWAMLHGLFDLTPAEARLAKHLASGETLNETAGRLGVSVTTLRTHLKSIFAKTGTSRQSELVSLLSDLSAIRPGNGNRETA